MKKIFFFSKKFSSSGYYNDSAVLLHGLTYCAPLGRGMSGSVSGNRSNVKYFDSVRSIG
jgi:hypothetical protein